MAWLWRAVVCAATAATAVGAAQDGSPVAARVGAPRPAEPVAAEPQPRLSVRLRGSKPNVVLIFIDDTGWGDYSFNDPARSDTPHLQALADSGLVLTDFHAAASVCTPSRAGLLTGRLGLRTGVRSNFSPFSSGGLPTNETTVAELLRGAGYATAATGKWHLGHLPPHSPLHRGFDAFLGLPMSHDYGCTRHAGYDVDCPHVALDVCEPAGGSAAADPASCHIGPNNPWNESIPLYDGDRIIEQPVDLRNLSDRYVDFAAAFASDASARGQPWFLYMPFNHMHVPVGNHEPQFTNTSLDRGVYGDTLRQLDASIGRLLQQLDASPHHRANHTLLLLTGDNGAPDDQCDFGGLNGPFTGAWLKAAHGGGGTGKTTTWEGGHREPGLAVWPTRIPPGGRSGALASALDVLPTLAALAGAPLPPHRVVDGVDLGPVLFDGAAEPVDTRPGGALFHPNSGGEGEIGALETARIGRFKAKWRTGGGAVDCARRVAPDHFHDPPLLFDLVADPAEANPMMPAHPNYTSALVAMRTARSAVAASIAADNTTTADYRGNFSNRPCCNHADRLCMCAATGAAA